MFTDMEYESVLPRCPLSPLHTLTPVAIQQTLPRHLPLHLDLLPLPHPTSVGVCAKRKAGGTEATDRGRAAVEADVEGYAVKPYVRPFLPFLSCPLTDFSSSYSGSGLGNSRPPVRLASSSSLPRSPFPAAAPILPPRYESFPLSSPPLPQRHGSSPPHRHQRPSSHHKRNSTPRSPLLRAVVLCELGDERGFGVHECEQYDDFDEYERCVSLVLSYLLVLSLTFF
jgi:hypothetical protein